MIGSRLSGVTTIILGSAAAPLPRLRAREDDWNRATHFVVSYRQQRFPGGSMVCTHCGASLEGTANFCPHCGAPVTAGAQGDPPPAYGYGAPYAGYESSGYGMPAYGAPPTMRVQRHLQILSVLWACFAVYGLLAGLAGMFFLRMWSHGHFGHHAPFPGDQLPFFSAILPFTLILTLLTTVLCGMVAYGLLQRRPWGRTMSIVLGIFSLLKFPVGTALGIYTLWVMAPALSAREYEAIADRSRPGL